VAHGPDDFGQSAVVMAGTSRASTQQVAASAEQAFFIRGSDQVWQSVNLGQDTQRGSTMQIGSALIIQGAGSEMWQGYDCCRYVWTSVTSNYVFSTQVQAIADNNSLAITGLLIKSAGLADGPSLRFGFLGSGHLFLQIREPNHTTVLVKRSERAMPIPLHLRLTRQGSVFEAFFSDNGVSWTPFGSCELSLDEKNCVGFAVSAQDASELATAKFSSISLDIAGRKKRKQ